MRMHQYRVSESMKHPYAHWMNPIHKVLAFTSDIDSIDADGSQEKQDVGNQTRVLYSSMTVAFVPR